MNRKQSLAMYNHRYVRIAPSGMTDCCQYCGSIYALTDDHIPAITTAQLFANNPNIKFMLVDACMECNLLLSDKLLPHFSDRFFDVKDTLLNRYKILIKNEFRTGFEKTSEDFDICDIEFYQMLDRIGFGLVKFQDLTDQDFLLYEFPDEERLVDKIADRSGGALLTSDYDVIPDEQEQEEDSDSDNYCSLGEFKEELSERDIYTLDEYKAWNKAHPSTVFNLGLPNYPNTFYNVDCFEEQALVKEVKDVLVQVNERRFKQQPYTLEMLNWNALSDKQRAIVKEELGELMPVT